MNVSQTNSKVLSPLWVMNAKLCGEPDSVPRKNGELLTLAEGRWDVMVTSDRNIKYRQNMAGRRISIPILCAKSNRMKDLLPLMPACAEALRSIQPGHLVDVGPL